MKATLKHGGDTAPVDLNDLDDSIRRGELPADAQLKHPPWTGESFRALRDIPSLAEAFEAPGARMASHFERPAFPWASTALTLGVLCAGLVQLFIGFLPLSDEALVAVFSLYEQGATGLEALVFEGRWASPWTSQGVHAGSMHLFPNLAVLGYCGFRVERALGARGYGLVAAASVLLGALFVALFQQNPVIGSSILGFGFWGAQLAIGFRFGDTLPPGARRYYGYGNLLFFAVLFGGTLYQENTSHWAHVGGLLGGVLATMLLRPAHVVASDRAPVVRRLGEAAIAATLLLTFVLGPLLRLLPVWGQPETLSLGEVGIELDVPSRLVPEDRTHDVTVRGMPAWTTSDASEEFAFAGLDVLDWELAVHGDPLTGEDLARHWGRRIEGEAVVVEAPPPRGPAWTAHALAFQDADGVARYLLVEQHLLRGRYLNRVGYVVALDERGEPGRRHGLFESITDSARVGEPPSLAEARSAHLRNAASARLRVDLAEALHDVGDFEQADAMYALVLDEGGRMVPEAVTGRLAMWRLHPEAFPVPEEPWFARWLEAYPADRGLQEDGIVTLAAAGHCAAARTAHERFAEARPDAAELVTTAGAVMKCEVLRGASPGPPGSG